MVLDTSVVVDLFRGDANISARIKKEPVVYLPATALGELYLGAFRAVNPTKHLSQIAVFLTKCTILPVDETTARQYGVIKAELMRIGSLIPENDMWIAAVALQHQLPLFTRDAHFALVPNLQVINPL